MISLMSLMIPLGSFPSPNFAQSKGTDKFVKFHYNKGWKSCMLY